MPVPFLTFLAGVLLTFVVLYPAKYRAEEYAEQARQYIFQIEAERDTLYDSLESCGG